MAINAGFPLYDAYQAIKVPNAGIQSVEKFRLHFKSPTH
jgi:hypothetical protein